MSKKILLIEDDVLFRDLIKKYLENAGHEMFTLSDGTKCMNAIEEQHIDILMTDILMEGQEGLETIGMIRDSHADLPIIAISSDEFYFDMAKDLGANTVISKPVTKEKIQSVVEQFS